VFGTILIRTESAVHVIGKGTSLDIELVKRCRDRNDAVGKECRRIPLLVSHKLAILKANIRQFAALVTAQPPSMSVSTNVFASPRSRLLIHVLQCIMQYSSNVAILQMSNAAILKTTQRRIAGKDRSRVDLVLSILGENSCEARSVYPVSSELDFGDGKTTRCD
jgi:hypothetical protein